MRSYTPSIPPFARGVSVSVWLGCCLDKPSSGEASNFSFLRSRSALITIYATYMPKRSTSISPSICVTSIGVTTSVSSNNMPVMAQRKGISINAVFFSTERFRMSEDIPRISRILIILLPTTLPIAISPLPSNADLVDTASSGALVPKATTVIPITNAETFSLPAIPLAPSTKRSAPTISRAMPTIIKSIIKKMSIVFP